MIATGIDDAAAGRLLKRAHANVKVAIVMQKTGLPYPKAVSRLRRADGLVREAVGEDIEPRLRELLGPLAAPRD
jgi:N-acetylmuramic acid 6-phosphate (MurNAc-6-P) etherase